MSKYYDKTAASFKSVTIDTKVLDAQKILINSNPNDINQRENLLDVLNEITPSYIYYQYIDYCEKPSGTGECCAVRLHTNLLPHDKNIKAVRLTVANTVNTETWLVAYLVDENGNFTSIGKSIKNITSNIAITIIVINFFFFFFSFSNLIFFLKKSSNLIFNLSCSDFVQY